MNQLQTSIEFHDSDLSACEMQDKMIVVELHPAYVHKWELTNGKWIGIGCVQDARITIENANVPKRMPTLPVQISDGMIEIGTAIFDNLVAVPFKMSGPSHLKLQLVTGETFEISGTTISIAISGECKFVEKLPEEWQPRK